MCARVLFSFCVFVQGKHYGVPGVNVDGQNMLQMLSVGRAVTDYVRSNGPAILQVLAAQDRNFRRSDPRFYTIYRKP